MKAQSYKLLSDQVDRREIDIILRELDAILASDIEGDVVEFGCYVGTTSIFLARRLVPTRKELYLYDSFEGLPPKGPYDESPAGTQFKTGELLATRKQLEHNIRQAHVSMPHITKGWFSDLTEKHVPGHISFAFLDGDYYESIKTPLLLIQTYLTPGATIIIDDYVNEALPGVARATNEWLQHKKAMIHVEHSLAIIHT